jgi:hypothetical protein
LYDRLLSVAHQDVRKLRHGFLLAGDAMLTATLYNFSWAFLRS